MRQHNILSIIVSYFFMLLFVFLFILVHAFVALGQEVARSDAGILPFKTTTTCLRYMSYLESTPLNMPSNPNMVNSDECNFIGENVSSVRVQPIKNRTYLSFCICGDTTRSVYYIVKTTDDEYYEILYSVTNIKSDIGVPLLYSCVDTVELTQHTYYKFFKMYPNGKMVLIATVSVPLDFKNNNSSILNYRRPQFYERK